MLTALPCAPETGLRVTPAWGRHREVAPASGAQWPPNTVCASVRERSRQSEARTGGKASKLPRRRSDWSHPISQNSSPCPWSAPTHGDLGRRGMDKFVLKFTWKNKHMIVVKWLDKDHTLLILKTCCKANGMKSARNWHRNGKTDHPKGTRDEKQLQIHMWYVRKTALPSSEWWRPRASEGPQVRGPQGTGQADRRMTGTNENFTLNEDMHFLKSCKYAGKVFCDHYFNMGKNFLKNIGNKEAIKLTNLAT